MIAAYLRYLSHAQDEHSIHSPFVFSLYTKAIRTDSRREPALASIRLLRNDLRRSQELIQITDLGAGSKVNGARQRTVSDIARHSQKSPRYARLLFRLIRYLNLKTVVDLGTSLGLTTAHLAEAVRSAGGRVLTFEGCPQTARQAQLNFDRLDLPNVSTVVGNIDDTLAPELLKLGSVDLVFFDANHRYEPTVRYFETCLLHRHNDTLFVFDDIHWSAEMEQAWVYIQAHPAVRVTIDLFGVGLVFFRQEQPRQDFILRFGHL
ncbi:O-methyltransferase [Spirosoma rhododendri]|uniref:Class I SAM-dependent methyltransferase n=1 Tax=Spirosoma rhododendri TaxID=2728024 RepID=A0A7L5DV11_9BACT|nr:class I SAM-dependent methyltransferase [Spirosoma rhododendri]QJD81321.1 class I SAM-dependent methyltransferase [Spirosoma rhododendri]